MTIQIPNVGTGVPADQTGDSPWLAMKKVRENFSDYTNAASRLVGEADGQIPDYRGGSIANAGFGGSAKNIAGGSVRDLIVSLLDIGTCVFRISNDNGNVGVFQYAPSLFMRGGDSAGTYATISVNHTSGVMTVIAGYGLNANGGEPKTSTVYSTANTTRDTNGFLKGASPIAEIYSDMMDLNEDAIKQGSITFKKLGVGNYLVKGSLGFAQEGWYIETPKDANGNVLVAVVYEQLKNNDLSIKTYAKKFDDETGDIVANLAKPRDIPVGRFISLRLHELPKEPPVVPTEV